MTTAALLGHVTAYAAQVRTHLSDLPSDQVDDLTDGLEADLAEALADPDGRPVTGEIPTVPVADGSASGEVVLDLTARFGAPADYAAELRAAAGMPPARDPDHPDLGPSRWEEMVAWWREEKKAITAHPAWPSVRSFAMAVRPAWWVARGWVLFGILFTINSQEGTVVAPGTAVEWIVFLGLVWLSVEYGRGRPGVPAPVRHVAVGLSVLAAVFLLPGMISMASPPVVQYFDASAYSEPVQDGVYVDGSRATNLFVYDAGGQYLERAQIFDNRGRAVTVDEPDGLWIVSEQSVLHWVPSLDVDGRQVPNAFPVPTLRSASLGPVDDLVADGTDVVVPVPPVRSVAPLDLEKPQGAEVSPTDGTGETEPGQDAPTADPAGPIDPTSPVEPSAEPTD